MQADFAVASHIPKDHPFYDLLTKNDHRLQNIFDILPTDSLKEPPNVPCPLKIYGRQNINNFGATFIYFYELPISPQNFRKMTQDYELHRKVDSNIDQYKQYKVVEELNTEMLYISYKRILIVMPRYFIYIRYTYQVGDDIWIIAISDPQFENDIKEKTKGEIILTAMRIRKTQKGCEVRVFSEIDMKMKLKFQMAFNTGSLQLTKYIKNIYKHIAGEK